MAAMFAATNTQWQQTQEQMAKYVEHGVSTSRSQSRLLSALFRAFQASVRSPCLYGRSQRHARLQQ